MSEEMRRQLEFMRQRRIFWLEIRDAYTQLLALGERDRFGVLPAAVEVLLELDHEIGQLERSLAGRKQL